MIDSMLLLLITIPAALADTYPAEIFPFPGRADVVKREAKVTVQATVKASVVIPSTSNVPVWTSSYVNPTTVPTGVSPFASKSTDMNGTVFVAVGTIVLALLGLLLLSRFFFWLKNRRDAHSFADIDDYYGRIYDYEKSLFGTDSEPDEKTNALTLQYDSQVFSEKRSASSNNSYHSSNPSSSSNTPQVTPPRPGRMLRNGSQTIPAQMNIKRASYISPINELASQENLGSTVSLQHPTHRKSSSISLLLARPENPSSPLLGSNSALDLMEIHEMVEQSLAPQNATTEKFKKGHKRPPSAVLDELLKERL